METVWLDLQWSARSKPCTLIRSASVGLGKCPLSTVLLVFFDSQPVEFPFSKIHQTITKPEPGVISATYIRHGASAGCACTSTFLPCL